MKQQNEVEKLLSLIFQSGGKIDVKDGRLWVAPVEIAGRFKDQIIKLKPEILITLGCCPVCSRELVVKIEEEIYSGKTMSHSYCSGSEPGHYDKWQI